MGEVETETRKAIIEKVKKSKSTEDLVKVSQEHTLKEIKEAYSFALDIHNITNSGNGGNPSWVKKLRQCRNFKLEWRWNYEN